MPTQTKTKFDLGSLEELANKLNTYAVKVGVLGSDASEIHGESTKTNAEIGMVHEFGRVATAPIIPQRSFLRMPVENNAKEILNDVAKSKMIRENVESGKVINAMKLIGVIAETYIQKAFATGGFGIWPALSKVTLDARKAKGHSSTSILIETAQLRRSISSEVVKKSDL